MIKKIVLVCLALISLNANENYQFNSSNSNVQLGFWGAKISGDIKNNSSTVDFQNDLGYGEANNITYFQADVDNDISWLPDVRLTASGLKQSVKPTLANSIVVADQNYSSSINTETQYATADLLFYSSSYSTNGRFSVGLNTKYVTLQEDLNQIGGNSSSVSKIDGVVVLPYVGFDYNLDMINTIVSGEATGFSIGDIKIVSYAYSLKYYFMKNIYLSYGYKNESFKADNANDKFTFNVSGRLVSFGMTF